MADEVVVMYLQPENQKAGTAALRQTLVTEAVVAAEEFYSSPDSDPLTKVTPTATMQLMLDGLATAGFFARAGRTTPRDSSSLLVRYRGTTYALARHRGMSAADWEAYQKSLSIFLNVYNGTEAFHVGPADREVFRREQERLNREGRARLQEELRKGNS